MNSRGLAGEVGEHAHDPVLDPFGRPVVHPRGQDRELRPTFGALQPQPPREGRDAVEGPRLGADPDITEAVLERALAAGGEAPAQNVVVVTVFLDVGQQLGDPSGCHPVAIGEPGRVVSGKRTPSRVAKRSMAEAPFAIGAGRSGCLDAEALTADTSAKKLDDCRFM